MISFTEFLASQDKLDATGEERKTLRKEYKRYYHRMYKRKQRAEKYITTLTLSKDELEIIKRGATYLGYSIPQTIKLVTFAYAKDEYVIPADIKEKLQAVLVQLKKQGTLLNQMLKVINITKQVNPDDVRRALELIKAQDQFIRSILTKKPAPQNDHQDLSPQTP